MRERGVTELDLRTNHRPLLRYAFSVACVAVALVLALEVYGFRDVGLPVIVLAIALVAWYAGPWTFCGGGRIIHGVFRLLFQRARLFILRFRQGLAVLFYFHDMGGCCWGLLLLSGVDSRPTFAKQEIVLRPRWSSGTSTADSDHIRPMTLFLSGTWTA